MQAILHVPVLADGLGELIGADLLPGQVGHGVDGLAVPAAAGRGAASAHDLDRQLGMREQDPAGHRVADPGELEGARLPPTMPGVLGEIHGWHVPPGQPRQLLVQPGTVALDDEHVMRIASVQVAGVLVLRVESVGSDDRAGDIDSVQQRGERGDLVRLPVDHRLTQHDAAAGIERREQVHRPLVGEAGAASGLAIHRDDPRRGCCDPRCAGPRVLLRHAGLRRVRGWEVGAGDQPVRHRLVQRFRVEFLQDPADRRLARRRPRNREPEPDPHAQRQVMGPFGDRDVAAGPGQHRAHRQREHRHQPMPDPAAGARVGHRRQRSHQIGRRLHIHLLPRGIGVGHTIGCGPDAGGEQVDRRGWAGGHDTLR
jgi:hypothetical protein